MTKKCSDCKIKKDTKFFYKDKNRADNLQYKCKECVKKINSRYRKTKNGLIAKIYGAQIKSSKGRGHSHPTYTKSELKEWLLSQEKFHVLYDNWKRLDFQVEYTPSVDRISDLIGYTMANIQLMTWAENYNKSINDKRGRSKTIHKHGIRNS